MPCFSNTNTKIILPDSFLPSDPHPVGWLIHPCKGPLHRAFFLVRALKWPLTYTRCSTSTSVSSGWYGLLVISVCCGLNWSPQKSICLNPNSQCDGIWGCAFGRFRGNYDWMRLWGESLHDGISALARRNSRVVSCSFPPFVSPP